MNVGLAIGNAAGTAKYPDEIVRFCDTAATRITGGTYTVLGNRGNTPIDPPDKVYWFDERLKASANAINLKNPGIQSVKGFLPGVIKTLHALRKEFYTSGAGRTPEEFAALVRAFVECGVDGVELNLKLIGPEDIQTVEDILLAVEEERERLGVELPVAVKIPPLENSLVLRYANAITRSGIVANVVATNTRRGQLLIRPDGTPALSYRSEKGGPVLHEGGLGGEPVRQRAAEIVRLLSEYLPPHIRPIGVGGIFTGAHAKQHIEAGAVRVQCATACFRYGPRILNTIAEEYQHLSA